MSYDNVKYVNMPWNDNTSMIYGDQLYTRWNLVKQRLSGHIPDIDCLVDVIKSYNVVFAEDGAQSTPSWDFKALRKVLQLMVDNQRERFFAVNGVLQSIQKLTLLFNDACAKLKCLQIGVEDSITLHQMQVASILANAFFCTFPKREKLEPSINFTSLFEGHQQPGARYVEKLKCLIHYFTRIHDKQPNGYITFSRRCTPDDQYPRWDRTPVKLCSILVENDGRIEDQAGYLQMDFANRTLGGGVLGWGCVQEEIRFVICPELIAARLFTEPMTDSEAFIIIGVERFSNYSGYANNFEFLSDHQDQTGFDKDQRRNVHILAVDAVNFHQPAEQYRESWMLREIKKIYTGLALRDGDSALPLATGNWGCGAFRGDPELKSLLQIMAASQTGRRVAYFTFGNQELKNNLLRTHGLLQELDISVGQLYRILARYNKDRTSKQTVFQFVAITAKTYANFTIARSRPSAFDSNADVIESGRTNPTGGSDSVLKRNCFETPQQTSMQSSSKLQRKNLQPWPRAWLEKEKPKMTKNQPTVAEKPLSQGTNQFDPMFDDSDDFIDCTPDERKTSEISSPSASELDLFEEKKKSQGAQTPVGFVFRAMPEKTTPSERPHTSLMDALDNEERKKPDSPPDIRICELSEKDQNITEFVEKMDCPTACKTPLSFPKLAQPNSDRKLSQTKLDQFFKK